MIYFDGEIVKKAAPVARRWENIEYDEASMPKPEVEAVVADVEEAVEEEAAVEEAAVEEEAAAAAPVAAAAEEAAVAEAAEPAPAAEEAVEA